MDPSPSSRMQAKLLVTAVERGRTRQFPLGLATVEGAELLVGRSRQADLPVIDDRVSGRHLSIRFENGQHWVRDLGSTNGTRLNGRPLTEPAPLTAGDIIQLGDASLLYDCETLPPLDSGAPSTAMPDVATAADPGAATAAALEDTPIPPPPGDDAADVLLPKTASSLEDADAAPDSASHDQPEAEAPAESDKAAAPTEPESSSAVSASGEATPVSDDVTDLSSPADAGEPTTDAEAPVAPPDSSLAPADAPDTGVVSAGPDPVEEPVGSGGFLLGLIVVLLILGLLSYFAWQVFR